MPLPSPWIYLCLLGYVRSRARGARAPHPTPPSLLPTCSTCARTRCTRTLHSHNALTRCTHTCVDPPCSMAIGFFGGIFEPALFAVWVVCIPTFLIYACHIESKQVSSVIGTVVGPSACEGGLVVRSANIVRASSSRIRPSPSTTQQAFLQSLVSTHGETFRACGVTLSNERVTEGSGKNKRHIQWLQLLVNGPAAQQVWTYASSEPFQDCHQSTHLLPPFAHTHILLNHPLTPPISQLCSTLLSVFPPSLARLLHLSRRCLTPSPIFPTIRRALWSQTT